MRVENIDAGRSTGEFRESLVEARAVTEPLKLIDEELENPMESIISEMARRETDAQPHSQGDGSILSLA